jgi:putative ABC transport system permease protein
MITNYLRSAWRTIRRHPFYSLITMGCLALGIGVSMTILLYVLHEHSFEKWQANARRIFSVTGTFKFGDAVVNVDRLSFSAGPLVRQADGRVESYLRVYPSFEPVNLQDVAKPETSFTESGNFMYADNNFFQFFSFRLVKGNPMRALDRPFTLVLTQRAAKKYFGARDPIGRTLRVNGLYDFEVTGIAADPPSNTDIRFDVRGPCRAAPSRPGCC